MKAEKIKKMFERGWGASAAEVTALGQPGILANTMYGTFTPSNLSERLYYPVIFDSDGEMVVYVERRMIHKRKS